MRLSEKQIKQLLAVRRVLLRRIERLRKQIKYYEDILQAVDNIIRSSSITTADKVLEKHVEKRKILEKCVEVKEKENVIELSIKFSIKRDDALFRKLVKEKLDRFKREDLSKVREGELDQEYMFDYEILTDSNNNVKVIRIWNCDTRRLNIILRAIETLCRKITGSG